MDENKTMKETGNRDKVAPQDVAKQIAGKFLVSIITNVTFIVRN